MSCFAPAPEMPVPEIPRRSTFCSAAIFLTTGDERVWRSSSTVISLVGLAGGGAGAGAGGGADAGAAVGGAAIRCGSVATPLDGTAANTWVMDPPGAGPEGRGSEGGGGAGGAAGGAGGAGGGGAEAGAEAAGADATASPSAAITPTTVLIGTVVPGATRISLRMPDAGDGISASTLSVEISKSGSSRSTRSPTFFIHLVT